MRKLYADAEKERRIQQALFVRISGPAQRQIRRTLTGAVKAAAKEYERDNDLGIDLAITQRTEALQKTLEGLWQNSYEGVGGRVARMLTNTGKAQKYFERKDFITDVFKRGIFEFIARYGAQKITTLISTTKNQVRGYIRTGMELGLSVRDIAELIRDNGTRDSLTRALVISRTEAHSAAMAGSDFAARESGVRLRKEWIAAGDERTRTPPEDEFDHVSADGQIVDMDQPFIVSGEQLKHPGDPAGSAGNIINCRCAQGYVMED